MKKISIYISIVLSFVLFFVIKNPIEVQSKTKDFYVSNEEYLAELKQTFPEYANYLDSLNENPPLRLATRSVPSREPLSTEPIYFEKRPYDEETEYSLVIFEDGTYASSKWVGRAHWTGGSSDSGSGYINYYNRQLTIFVYMLRHPMLIHDISYTISYDGYDHFMDGGHGYSFINNVGSAAYPSKTREDSSGPAYSQFSGTNYVNLDPHESEFNMQVRLEVGSNTTKVFANEIRLY